jgi:uncharacterized membrane protein
MEKIPTKKAVSLISALKGKKPVVIIACVVIFIVGIFAAKKGYISEDLLDVNNIVSFVNGALASDSTKAAVDTAAHVIDSLPK